MALNNAGTTGAPLASASLAANEIMLTTEALDFATTIVDLSAVAVFAVTGALAASRKEMDIFGFAVLGTAVGIGGGTVRDVLLGKLPVFWVTQPSYVMICVLASLLVYFTAHIPHSRYRSLLWFDAIGLSMVAVVGAEKGLAASGSAIVALVMAAITGSFGGIIRDVLSGEIPLLLRREIYVTAALAGAAVYLVANGLGSPRWLGLAAGAIVCFTVRGLAIYYHWQLPSFRPRPGRTVAEIEATDSSPAGRQQ